VKRRSRPVLVIRIAVALCLVGSFAALQTARAATPGKPNVVLILANDLGWTDLACYGSTFYEIEIAGGRPTMGRGVDGTSLVPLLRQTGELTRDGLLWHYPHYQHYQLGAPWGRRTPALSNASQGRARLRNPAIA
jgi:hypothetical protein